MLSLIGRRSGAAISLPVRYEQHAGTLIVVSRPSRQWWRNLHENTPVRLTLRGRARYGHATVTRAGQVVVVTIRLDAEQPGLPPDRGRLWWRWTKAVTLGEIAGFAAPVVVAAQLGGPEWTLLGIGPLLRGVAIVMAGAVEGTILGLAQAYVLRAALPAIPTRAWVRATAAGAVIAWGVGVLPIVLGERILRWPPAVLVLLGLILLGSMGLLQARVLRGRAGGRAGGRVGGRGSGRVSAPWRWVVASAGSWLIALGAFALVTTPLWQEGQPGWLIVAIGVLGGAVMAATVAALTGAAFVHLLPPSFQTERPMMTSLRRKRP
ncbi:hypothetical protein FXF51_31775 [Nonomuraea sp. PA05]|uniref:hypothetical protein n=1 Tax=Nonomuraea sp. PA05 TaxID=2604466 RepID=UPI0011D54B23|nr:hypothetical protein [Nonomuraea sp. PA05]TYB60182.1 hypothetical protein FXF51_31775 [Nonomuraea sp. PA05]